MITLKSKVALSSNEGNSSKVLLKLIQYQIRNTLLKDWRRLSHFHELYASLVKMIYELVRKANKDQESIDYNTWTSLYNKNCQ